MKNRHLSLFLIFALILSFTLFGCQQNEDESETLWDSALYTEDKVLGDGSKSIVVKVSAQDKSVVFTINTDKEYLSDALMEHKLISGVKGTPGMYIDTVNGMHADYDKDKVYWAFYEDGEYMSVGADSYELFGGEDFEIVYESAE